MFYSSINNAWFDPSFRADYERRGSWPADAIEYPREKFDEVVRHRTADKMMVPDENGFPILVDNPPLTDQDRAANIRAERGRLLAAYVDPIVSNPLRWNDLSADKQQAIIAYRKTLLDIPEQPGFPLAVEWPPVPE